jgi:hypothetical protein
VFLTGIDRLSDDRIAGMFDMLAAGDPSGESAPRPREGNACEVYAARDLAYAERPANCSTSTDPTVVDPALLSTCRSANASRSAVSTRWPSDQSKAENDLVVGCHRPPSG